MNSKHDIHIHIRIFIYIFSYFLIDSILLLSLQSYNKS